MPDVLVIDDNSTQLCVREAVLRDAGFSVLTASSAEQALEMLRDHEAINTRFGELQSEINEEILVFTKPPYATPPQENVEGLDVVRSHRCRR